MRFRWTKYSTQVYYICEIINTSGQIIDLQVKVVQSNSTCAKALKYHYDFSVSWF